MRSCLKEDLEESSFWEAVEQRELLLMTLCLHSNQRHRELCALQVPGICMLIDANSLWDQDLGHSAPGYITVSVMGDPERKGLR